MEQFLKRTNRVWVESWIDKFVTSGILGGKREVNPYCVVDKIPLSLLLNGHFILWENSDLWYDVRQKAYDLICACIHSSYCWANPTEGAAELGRALLLVAFGKEKMDILLNWKDPNYA